MVVAVVAVVEVVVVEVATDPTTTLVAKIFWWVDPGYLIFLLVAVGEYFPQDLYHLFHQFLILSVLSL